MRYIILRNYDYEVDLYDPYAGDGEDDIFPHPRHDGFLVMDKEDGAVEYITYEDYCSLKKQGIKFGKLKDDKSISLSPVGDGVRIFEEPENIARITFKGDTSVSFVIRVGLYGGENTCFYLDYWDGNLSHSLNNNYNFEAGSADDDKSTFSVDVGGKKVDACYFISVDKPVDGHDPDIASVLRVATMFFEKGETHPKDMNLGYKTYEPNYDMGYPVPPVYYEYLRKLRAQDNKAAFLSAIAKDLVTIRETKGVDLSLDSFSVEWL